MKLLSTIAIATLLTSASVADDELERLRAFQKELDGLLDARDVDAAIALIESRGKPQDVASAYSQAVSHAYRNRKDVTNMLAFGKAARQYCLMAAKEVEGDDAELADKLRSFAKGVSYNVAVNAWPGWEEPGITITREHSLAALAAAQANLRLGIELKKPDLAMGNAHWMMGAQYLALGKYDKAIAQFGDAVDHFDKADKPDYRHMAEGYAGIAKLLQVDQRDAGRKTLDTAIASLQTRQTSDAKFFISQLKQVEKVFVKRNERADN